MKATDLKLNNLLYTSGKNHIEKTVGIVSEIKEKHIRFKGIGSDHKIEDCQPIPLTEEWLKKAGFENWGTKVCNEYEKYERWVLHNIIDGTSNFEVHIITSIYGGRNDEQICFSIDNDERQYIHETDFVHNLQNAFKQATGFELEFNL